MAKAAPTPVDVLDFQFKLRCRLKIFRSESNDAFNKPCNVIATASRYGLVFVGSSSSYFQVIQVEDLEKYTVKDGEISNYARRNITLPSKPLHLAVNCDSTKLSVVYNDSCVKALVYDIPSFLKQAVSATHDLRLSATPNVNVLEVTWNPTVPSIFTACKSDGSLGLYELKDSGIDINELPSSTGASCMCWSPKGKQIAVGGLDGKITQYKPDLKVAKVINAPPLEGNQSVVALQWISNYQFVGIYRLADLEAVSSLLIVDAPKTGEVCYTSYDDVCYSYGVARPHQFYMVHQPAWNILIVASSNSMEVGVLGLEQDNWTQWILSDSARAELPLSSTKQDTLPIGLTFNTSSMKSIPWGENILPPAPYLLLLSHHGVLCCFSVINIKQGSPAICQTPEQLPDKSGLKHFCVNEPDAPIETRSLKETVQNITPEPIVESQIIVTPTPSIGNKIKLMCGPSVTITKTTSTPAKAPSSPFESQFHKPPTFNVKATPAAQMTKSTPILEQVTPPKATTNQISEMNVLNEDTENLIAQMVKEECLSLESELKVLLHRGYSFKLDLIGSDNEATEIVEKTNNFQTFLNEVTETSWSQAAEIHGLKQNLMQMWVWYEEARSRFSIYKDPKLMVLIRTRPLDPASERQLNDIKHLLFYLESQMNQANIALDEQWETFQDSCRKKISYRIPSIEAIYQLMVKQNATLQKQTYILKDISSRMRRRNRNNQVPHLLVSLDNADKLEEQLKNLHLEPKDLFQLQHQRILDRQKLLSTSKSEKLRNLLLKRKIVHVSVTKPQLTNSMLQLSTLLGTPFSPIAPNKKLPPQKLDFVQSTPKPELSSQSGQFQTESSTFIPTPGSAFVPTQNISFTPVFDAVRTPSSTNLIFSTSSSSTQKPSFFSTKAPVAAVPTATFSVVAPNTPTSTFGRFTFSLPQNNQSIGSSLKSNISASSAQISPKIMVQDKPETTQNAPSAVNKSTSIFSGYPNATFSSASSTTSMFPLTSASSKTPMFGLPSIEPSDSKVTSTLPTQSVSIFSTVTQKISTVSNSQATTPTFAHTSASDSKTMSQTSIFSGLGAATSRTSMFGSKTNGTTNFGMQPSSTSKSTTSIFGIPVTSTTSFAKPSNVNVSIFGTPAATSATTTIFTTPSSGTSIFNSSILGSATSDIYNESSKPSIETPMSVFAREPISVPSTTVTILEIPLPSARATSVTGAGFISSSTTTTPSTVTTVSGTQPITTSVFGLPLSSTTVFGSPASNPTIFGGTPSGSSIFGTSTACFGTSSSGTTNFGAVSSSTSNFGAVSSSTTSFGTPTSNTTSFGAPTSNTTSFGAPTSKTTSFGTPTSNTTIFGTPTSNTTSFGAPMSSTSRFGTPTSTISFGGPTSSTTSFGAPMSSTTPSILETTSSTTVFGTPTTHTTAFQTPSSSTTIFGKPITTPSFGPSTSSATILEIPSSMFGKVPAVTTSSIFGAPTTQTSIFGAPANTSVFSSSSSAFGAPKTTASVFGAGSIFGPITTTFSTFGSSGFGTSTAPTFGQASSFGSSSIFSTPAATSGGSIFGGTASGATNSFGNPITSSVFGTPTSSTPFGDQSSVFGAPAAGPFGTTSGSFGASQANSFSFAAPANAAVVSNSDGTTFGFNQAPFGGFGTNTNASSFSFGGLNVGSAAPTTTGFGSSFTQNQNPFGRSSGQEQKSVFDSGNLFGTPVSTSSSSVFGGTSPFNKQSPSFGAPASFGSSSGFGQQQSPAFGQGGFGSSVFGGSSQPGGPFSGGSQSVAQSGFGAAPVFPKSSGFGAFGSTSPGGFGSPAAFGNSPAFAATSSFGSPNKMFGGGAQPTDAFGSSSPQNSTFANLANQPTLGFGNLAQHNQPPTSQSTAFSGGSSFSSWR